MMPASLIKNLMIVAIGLATLTGSELHAQNQIVRDYFRDYCELVPRAYSPDDPWQMGQILRLEVGHGRFFYNCDYEECKRQSPYINWNQQNHDCYASRPAKVTINQQFEEIKRRIRWGACKECANPSGDCNCPACSNGEIVDASDQISEYTTLQAANKVWERAIPKRPSAIPSSGLSDTAETQIAGNRNKIESLLVQSRTAARKTQQQKAAATREKIRLAQLRANKRQPVKTKSAVETGNDYLVPKRDSSRATVAKLLKQARQESANPQRNDRVVTPKQQRPTRSARRPGTARVIPAKQSTAERPLEVVESKSPTTTRPSETTRKNSFLTKLLAPPKKYAAKGRGMGVAKADQNQAFIRNLSNETTRQANRDNSSDGSFRMLRR